MSDDLEELNEELIRAKLALMSCGIAANLLRKGEIDSYRLELINRISNATKDYQEDVYQNFLK